MSGSSIELGSPSATLVAHVPGEVRDVLRAAEKASSAGAWVAGLVSYEAAPAFDSALVVRSGKQPGNLPLAWFGLFEEARTVETLSPRRDVDSGYQLSPWRLDVDFETYRRRVELVRERIAEGLTYQVNLTARMLSHFEGDAFELYRDLALAQRGRYCAYLDTGEAVVASASPELFFEWSEGTIVSRPMKGTAARGRWPEEDRSRARGLLCSEKDRAENVMIVDLVRNDLGRLATYGGVQVRSLYDLERLETVWQLTSTIAATPREGIGLCEVFDALFPCGSVTGAPKAATMAVISSLEDSPRGVYCGAVGFLSPSGGTPKARFNVAIRTVVVDKAAGDAVFGTGGGITWDSEAVAEHAELQAKAALLSSPTGTFDLIETMAVPRPGEIRNLEGHLCRLMGSASYFGFEADREDLLLRLQSAAAGASSPARLRAVLCRSGELRLEIGPMPPSGEGPVRLALDDVVTPSSAVWRYHKTTRRDAYAAASSRHPGADDVILVNERKEASETTIANLAVLLDGAWWTPPLSSGCLPGVERGRLIAEGRLRERVVSLDDLYRAEGLALISSLRGWRSAVLVSANRPCTRDTRGWMSA